jgi:hypothetical protein
MTKNLIAYFGLSQICDKMESLGTNDVEKSLKIFEAFSME